MLITVLDGHSAVVNLLLLIFSSCAYFSDHQKQPTVCGALIGAHHDHGKEARKLISSNIYLQTSETSGWQKTLFDG